MHNIIKKLETKEKNFLILAFLIPLTVRIIPEILSWPYPIGFDTLIYINHILNNNFLEINLFILFKSTQLFYIIANALNIIIKDPILEMKILGPILFSLLCYMVYIYCRKVLDWNAWKSLCANIIASTYFVSLRISWEMYRQMLGTTLLFATLIILKGKFDRKKIFLTIIFSLLTVWTHELATVLLFSLTTMHIIAYEKKFKEKTYLLISIIPAIALFIYQIYNPTIGTIQIPSYPIYASNQLELYNYITGFLIYIFTPLLPLTMAGIPSLKKLDIFGWTTVCITLTYWPIISTEQALPIWFRFAILLFYPIMFLATEGFERLWNFKKRILNKSNIGKTLALTTLSINLIMSGFYITSLPENAFYYFGELNNYKAYIQTSMLQNTVSISDTPNVIAAIKWVDQNLDKENTTLILHEAIAYWVKIYIKDKAIKTIVEPSLPSPLKESIENIFLQTAEKEIDGGKQVYTIWWANGKGWYRMPTIPEKFIKIKHFNSIAIYKYVP